ncbi:hypothetical protein F0562_025417 [Nyssa sinensis]|uniref:Uncharacterized protein n=1 Tax=Nyssa sinensis TaxID=561372 RepID=A0A5J5BFE2_9ASTE|nr:hypothetical protein F0562_025417 [Nyssa sinensis]
MEAQGLAESVSASVLKANISNVHGRHDLSALLLESQFDDISEGVDGDAREDASIHDTYSAHSWANCAEEGEFIPQVALDLEADKGLSYTTVRGGHSIGEEEYPLGNQGEAMRAVLDMTATKSGFLDPICGSKGLSIQAKNGENPLGNSWIHGREGGPSIGMQKAESAVGAATFCPTMGGISGGAKEERPLDNSGNQGDGVGAIQDLLIATKQYRFRSKMCQQGTVLFGRKWGKNGAA